MHPDRLAEFVHFLPERQVLRAVERLADDIGINLHAEGAKFVNRALRLSHAGVGCVERDLRDPAREMVALLRAQFGEAVIDEADQLVDLRGSLGKRFHRRLRIGEDLLIILEAVDHLLAMIEIEQCRQRTHAFAHVLVVAGDLLHFVEEFFREKVRIRIDPHLRSSGLRGLLRAWQLCVPDAVQREQNEVVHRRSGTATGQGGPGSAAHHFVLRCARDTLISVRASQRYSAAMRATPCASISARQRASASPSGSASAAVRALATASIPRETGMSPARIGRMTRVSIAR